MPWFLRCSWCGGPFNGGNCRRYTNVSFRDEFVRNPDPISYDETLDFSYPPPQPRHTRVSYVGTILTMVMIVHHGYRLSMSRNRATIKTLCQPRNQNIYEPNLCYNSNSSSFDQSPQYSIDHQPQSIQKDLNQQRMDDECIKSHNDMIDFNSICYDDDDDEESTIPLNEIISQIPPSIAITPVLTTVKPEESLIMGDKDLHTIPEKE
ncbi:hypothetical protein Tco_1225806 [Tanacetum coccineum]